MTELGAAGPFSFDASSGNMVGVPFNAVLADRIREALDEYEVREVAMFGGRSFMVHETLAVAAASDGSLLVRCAPEELDALLPSEGARPAEMRGKPMSRGWIRIDVDAVQDDIALARWIDAAVGYAETRSG